jgi:hypothetical protein
VLPRRAAVTRVHFARRHEQGRSDMLALPTRAPARQCGYKRTVVVRAGHSYLARRSG